MSLAYLPVEVAHCSEIRHTPTDEFVSPFPALDHAATKARFERSRKSLEAGEWFAEFTAVLDATTFPAGINKIVTFALSPITRENDQEAMPGIARHALALALRDILANNGKRQKPREIKCFAQDPIYSPVDQQVLAEAGFTVLDDPRAFLEVDENSVVIRIAPHIPVRQIIADIARPAVMIWTALNAWDPHPYG